MVQGQKAQVGQKDLATPHVAQPTFFHDQTQGFGDLPRAVLDVVEIAVCTIVVVVGVVVAVPSTSTSTWTYQYYSTSTPSSSCS